MTAGTGTSQANPRPSIAELRAVAQPPSTVGRVSGEHWAGRLYQRHLSIYLTRALVPTRVSANAVTWSLVVLGIGSAVVLTIPHLWSAVVAFLLIQVQGTVDCVDGELARWRGQHSPVGIYVDRVAHYVTDGALAVAVGVHADGGLGSIGGWTAVGLATGFLALLSKAETDLVHVARAQTGLERVADTAETARSRAGLIRRLRRFAAAMPFNRALLALELTMLAVVAAVVDAARGGLSAFRVLDVGLLVVAGIVVVGHLLATVTSDRLR
ncbi:MAG TPA: CDP-alcohol phosphatidyltransferase family protein [Mycobacteriales bacterium]|nr:CDP-alcohol phosphatidyltransferase family protein [Mycobacteriales bacterium]